MTKQKSTKNSKRRDRSSLDYLFSQLSTAGRRRFFELQLAEDFPAFVMKVFETVSSGDVFLSNWHIDAMTYAAERVMDGEITRLIVTVPPRHLKSIIFSVGCTHWIGLVRRSPYLALLCPLSGVKQT